MIILCMLILSTVYHQCLCKNDCEMSALDNYLKSMTRMLGDGSVKWPENEQENTEFCRQMYEAIEQAKSFKRECYQGLSRSLLKFTINAFEYTNIKLSCKSNEEMARFVKRGKCGNRAKRGTTKCWNQWIDKLNLIKYMTPNNKVLNLCCSVLEWKTCSLNVYRGISKKVCSKRSVDGFDNYMQRSVVDPLNIIFHCGDQDINQCKVQPPRYKTPFPAILEISSSL